MTSQPLWQRRELREHWTRKEMLNHIDDNGRRELGEALDAGTASLSVVFTLMLLQEALEEQWRDAGLEPEDSPDVVELVLGLMERQL